MIDDKDGARLLIVPEVVLVGDTSYSGAGAHLALSKSYAELNDLILRGLLVSMGVPPVNADDMAKLPRII